MGTSEWIWLIECVLCYLRTQNVILSDPPRGDDGGLSREYVLRIPSVS